MVFNSLSFAFFLPLVFGCYWLLTPKRIGFQNALLLVASYFFYACWDYRFLFLLIFSTALDYFAAQKISNSSTLQTQKRWLWCSIIINLGFLGIFKYYNFFVGSFAELLAHFHLKISFQTLSIVLPIGISFYTFHGLSYIIDVFYKRISPEKNIVDYSLFVSFFPLLVAGPIERATHLLPQIKKERSLSPSDFTDGLKQILWGLFKKMVVADSCAIYANQIFNNATDFGGSTLLLGAVFFTFQIYGDFSGYSDIALGTARLFGFELLQNFKFPYFSRDIAEFWRRWHISLSSWFKDYVYIPLGGSKGSKTKQIRNVLIIFLLSGLWHGASWNFVIWGLINAIYFIPLLVFNRNRSHLEIAASNTFLPSLKELFQITVTFCLTVLAWIFFRSASVGQAIGIIQTIFSESLFTIPSIKPKYTILMLLVFIAMEWLGRKNNYAIASFFASSPAWMRWMFYYLLVFSILYCSGSDQQFIYFQF